MGIGLYEHGKMLDEHDNLNGMDPPVHTITSSGQEVRVDPQVAGRGIVEAGRKYFSYLSPVRERTW